MSEYAHRAFFTPMERPSSSLGAIVKSAETGHRLVLQPVEKVCRGADFFA